MLSRGRGDGKPGWTMTNDEIPGWKMTNDEIPNDERMTNSEFRKTQTETRQCSRILPVYAGRGRRPQRPKAIRTSSFGLLSSLGTGFFPHWVFRNSSFSTRAPSRPLSDHCTTNYGVSCYDPRSAHKNEMARIGT